MSNLQKGAKIDKETYLKYARSPEILLAEKCRRSLYTFVKTFWHVVATEKAVMNWHIEYICEEVQKVLIRMINREEKQYDLIINVPPGSTKSTIVTQMANAWIWTIDQSIRVMTGSFSATLAADHSSKTRDILQSDLYRQLFPYLRLKDDQNAKSHYKTTKNGERYAIGIYGAVTGFHFHVQIIDDPINPKESLNEDKRAKAVSFFTDTLPSRKVNKKITPLILIMQRLHTEDPTGYIIKNRDNVKHISIPAEITSKVKPKPLELEKYYKDGLMDVVRMPRETLDEAKKEMGSMSYNGQMMQEPVDPSGNLLKLDWFDVVPVHELPKGLLNNIKDFNGDTATKDKSSNDPSAILAYTFYNNDLWLIDWVNKRMEFPELIEEIKDFVTDLGHKQSKVYIEPKSSGSSVVQQLRRFSGLNIMEYKMEAGDKIQRLNACIPYCEARRIKLVKGYWNQEFLDQCTMFPRHKHDEAIDNLTMAITQSLIRNGVKPQGRKWKS